MQTNADLTFVDDTWNQCTYTTSPEHSALVGYVQEACMEWRVVCKSTWAWVNRSMFHNVAFKYTYTGPAGWPAIP